MRKYMFEILSTVLLLCIGCGDGVSVPANENVRLQIDALAPAANIGHRGTGITRVGHPFPENALSSFAEAVRQGADGIELDVELTSDGQLLVMHDDTLERTTNCTGCLSAMTFAQARACALLDGSGAATAEVPPTLEEVYAAMPGDALVNVELKVYEDPCTTPSTGAAELARVAVEEVERLGVQDRTLFSSFDIDAAEAVKLAAPDAYSAWLLVSTDQTSIDQAARLGLDALHPLFSIDEDTTRAALAAGLQVNTWTVNDEVNMAAMIGRGVTAIITDEPAILAGVVASIGAIQ